MREGAACEMFSLITRNPLDGLSLPPKSKVLDDLLHPPVHETKNLLRLSIRSQCRESPWVRQKGCACQVLWRRTVDALFSAQSHHTHFVECGKGFA